MIDHYFRVVRTFTFKGRADRSEFWWFFLFNVIATIALRFASVMFGLVVNIDEEGNFAIGRDMNEDSLPLLEVIYQLLVIVQQIALQVRRLHDRNLSGWWLLVAFVIIICATIAGRVLGNPMIATVVAGLFAFSLLVINVLPGERAPNKYGPDPKAEPGEEYASTFA